MSDVYMPSKDVIYYERAKFEREMREVHWPNKVLVSIMIHDMPSIATAKMLIKKFGHQLALLKISHMIDYHDKEIEDVI